MKKALILIVPLFLAACDANYTVEYWNTHKEERNTYLGKCRNGDVNRKSQNCENARISGSLDATSSGAFE